MFPAVVTVASPLVLVKTGVVYAFSLNITALLASIIPVLGTSFVSLRVQRIVTAAGAIAAGAADDIIIVKKTVGAATTVNVNWAVMTRPLTIVDGKADANTNNITIVPSAGQTQYGTADYQVVIDGNGGSVTLTPLADGSGSF
jgi:hypothetical protein